MLSLTSIAVLPLKETASRQYVRQVHVPASEQNRANGVALSHCVLGLAEPEDQRMDLAKIEKLTRELLAAIGEDPTREGLVQTPARVAALYSSLFRGTDKDLESCIRSILPLPDSEGRTYVALRDIPFYSVCEHHFVPFFGMMSIAFAPERFTVGLGDIVRLVDLAAARLQLQERLTVEVAETIDRCLCPVALVVHVTAKHLCMDLNRDTRTHSTLRTSHYSGDLNISNQLEDAIRSSVPEREGSDLWPPPLATTSS